MSAPRFTAKTTVAVAFTDAAGRLVSREYEAGVSVKRADIPEAQFRRLLASGAIAEAHKKED